MNQDISKPISILSPKSIFQELVMLLAELFEYPDKIYAEKVNKAESVARSAGASYAYIVKDLVKFRQSLEKLSITELEECFTRTFDLAPICNPYISSYIYGDENYERGALMSNLAEKYKELNLYASNELPDHIALVLKYLTLCAEEERRELIEYCLSKPISLMRESLENASSPFVHILNALSSIIALEEKK